MALYDLVRCDMPLPDDVAGVREWRARGLGLGFQTFEIDAQGALRLFRLERRLHEDHPPRPALLDPGYSEWLRLWTRLEMYRSAVVGFSGALTLEGRDAAGVEWTIETVVEAGRCAPFRIGGGPAAQPVAAAGDTSDRGRDVVAAKKALPCGCDTARDGLQVSIAGAIAPGALRPAGQIAWAVAGGADRGRIDRIDNNPAP